MRDPMGRSMSPPVLWPVHRNSCVQDFWCFAVCQRHSFACRFVSSWSNDCAVLNDCYWWRKSGEWISSDQLLLLLSMVIPRVLLSMVMAVLYRKKWKEPATRNDGKLSDWVFSCCQLWLMWWRYIRGCLESSCHKRFLVTLTALIFFTIIQNTHTWSHCCTLELTVLQLYLSTNTYPQIDFVALFTASLEKLTKYRGVA